MKATVAPSLVIEVDEQATVVLVMDDDEEEGDEEEEEDVVVVLLEREIVSWFAVLVFDALNEWGI